jgi:ribonuclease HI
MNVFTDGACINNGKPNAKAGIGVFLSENDTRNVSRRVIGKQTNNVAELSAILEVFSILEEEIERGDIINIYSDSKYSINSFTLWAIKWEQNNWTKKEWNKSTKTSIQNLELIKRGYELFNKYNNVNIFHIKAHTGLSDELSVGNENADRLANMSVGL